MSQNIKKIIRDTREKENHGWSFSSYGATIIERKLEIGDYCVEGYENVLFIDRKASPSEIAHNLSKEDSPRFHRELAKAAKLPYRYLIFEFTLDNLLGFPKNTNLQKKTKIRTNGKYLCMLLNQIETKYDIEIIFCSCKEEAEEKAWEIINRVCK